MIDRARSWLLIASLTLVTIPGFSGMDLHLFGIRLGRFQPFKFVFIAWLVVQGAWIVREGYYRLPAPVAGAGRRMGYLLLGSVLLLDFALALGLIAGGGPGRGWGMYSSLLLGQLAALLCVLDRKFPAGALVRGIGAATGVLVFFSALEMLFPKAPFTLAFLRLVRDSPVVQYQLGASLTVAALAEFTVRALPLVILAAHRSRLAAFSSAALVAMGLLTLEKSAILSWIMVFFTLYLSGYGRRFLKPALAVGAAAVVGVVLYKGPEQVLGRYFGMFMTTSNDYTIHARISVDERKALWDYARQLIAANPLTGIGLDGFAARNTNLQPASGVVVPPGTHCHSLLLELGVSGGVFALLGFAGAFLLGGIQAWRSSPRRWALLLYLAAQSVSALVDARIYVSWLAITLFWFAGLAWAGDPAAVAAADPAGNGARA